MDSRVRVAFFQGPYPQVEQAGGEFAARLGRVDSYRPEADRWKADEVRGLLSTLETKPAGPRTVVISHLEGMSAALFPMLLKSIEEPIDLTSFVLVSSGELPPTIESRVDYRQDVVGARVWEEFGGVEKLKNDKRTLAERVLTFPVPTSNPISAALNLADEVEELGKAIGGTKNAKAESRRIALYLLDGWRDHLVGKVRLVDRATEFLWLESCLLAIDEAEGSLRTYGAVSGALGSVGAAIGGRFGE